MLMSSMYTGLFANPAVVPQTYLSQPPLIDPEILSKQGTGFLEESPGNRSSMRLMCMFALFAAIVFGALTMVRSNGMPVKNADGTISTFYPPRDDTGLTLTFGFLIAAFAPKAIQKFAEQRLGTYSPTPGTAAAAAAAALQGQNQMLTTALANAVEDPRLSALQMEINALRTKLAQPSPPPPPSSNGTVHAAAVATPLQQIRQGDSL
jgi:hypothetical protein